MNFFFNLAGFVTNIYPHFHFCVRVKLILFQVSLILETLRGHSGISENRKTSNARVFGKKKKRVTEHNDKTTINEKPQTSTLRSLNKLKFAEYELYPISGTNQCGKTENNRIWRPEKTHLKFSLDKYRTETSNIEISS